ncbi:hypothetical protein B0T22DRAFT_171761 [Podospora appendiculata]|uniref:AAA+ ATPase domain-containing protein n=1 Tax=Podospora appendiculata TaxID=314037 RepID=A0AAE1CDB4_9PEZI|nr:hypothetical protein B0T22DRAFT_171761 [Podospora appendiculata]
MADIASPTLTSVSDHQDASLSGKEAPTPVLANPIATPTAAQNDGPEKRQEQVAVDVPPPTSRAKPDAAPAVESTPEPGKEEPGAAKAVASIVKKLQEFNTALRVDLSWELAQLRSAIGDLPSQGKKEDDGDDDDDEDSVIWVCEPKRLTMEDWRKPHDDHGYAYGGPYGYRLPPYPVQPPNWVRGSPDGSNQGAAPPKVTKHVLKAFYRSIPTGPSVDLNSISTPEDFEREYSTAGRSAERPLRVQIMSETLIDELREISQIALQIEESPFSMIPPYKLLLHNWSKIQAALSRLKDQLKDLESVQEASTAPASNEAKLVTVVDSEAPDSEDAAKPKPSSSKSEHDKQIKQLKTRVSHLQCLHDFIKTDLGYLIGLRLKIKNGSLKTITFDEVYHLFSPGDLVMTSDAGEDQLYQVYSVTGGRPRLGTPDGPLARRVHDLEDSQYVSAGIGTWTDVMLQTYFMGTDGSRIGPHQMTLRVDHFVGERNVTDLDVFPLRFHRSAPNLCERLQARGRRFVNCYGHKKYVGIPMTPRTLMPDEDSDSGGPPRRQPQAMSARRTVFEEIRGDVFVDAHAFYHQHLRDVPRISKLKRGRTNPREVYEAISGRRAMDYLGDHEVDEGLTDEFLQSRRHLLKPAAISSVEDSLEHLQLLPYQVPAYEFRSRQWVWLDVDRVEEINKSDEARRRGWIDLVIPEEYSQLLVSLVDNHTSGPDASKGKSADPESPNFQIDLVRGKGRGLIILLHGPPGSGKTSTAETIAAYTGRPLYSITCGDIGVTPVHVENNLQYHTELAAKWGCVLLLDEADVFLTKRSWNDMNRNALVSVFLRHLEYYSGILFLTTNIVGVIDEAFKSRIHISLRYPSIDLPSTEKIWNNLLNRIAKDNQTADVRIEFNRATLLAYARWHYRKHEASETTWNGRQVRNAFQTAIALGQYDRLNRIKDEGLTPEQALSSGDKSLRTIRLTKRNFASIAKTARDFEDYISAIRGSDRELAQASNLRNDDFGRDIPRAQKNYGPRVELGRGVRAATVQTPPLSTRKGKGKEVPPVRKTKRQQEEEEEDEDDDDEDGEEGEEGEEGQEANDEEPDDEDLEDDY